MYKIIGADDKVYGPVATEVVHQWIAQGRANSQTKVLCDGATVWQALGELPEFAAALARAAVPTLPPGPLSVHVSPRTNPLATASLMLGLVSVTFALCCCYGFPFNLAGIICAVMALAQVGRDPQHQGGRGLAIVGLALCLASILLAVLLRVFSAALGSGDLLRQIRNL